MDRYPAGSYIGTYTTLEQAQLACNENDQCGSITDDSCDGDDWLTFTGISLLINTSGSCSWMKLDYGVLKSFRSCNV